MDIRQLRYFIAVAEQSSFSAAAQQCYASQSALSQQIRLLEAELGVPLFVRNTHGVSLTEQGDELLPRAREAVKAFEACGEHIAEIQGSIAGQLRLGMTYSLEPYVRRTMVEILHLYPKLHVKLLYATTVELRQMLMNHEIDLAFNINSAGKDECIASTPIVSYFLRAVMSRTHPLATRQKVTYNDLVNQPLILPENKTYVATKFGSYINRDLQRLNVRAHINSPNAILNLLQETHCVSIMSAKSVSNRPMLVAREIEGLDTPIQCYVHNLKDVCLKNSAKEFLRIFRDMANEEDFKL